MIKISADWCADRSSDASMTLTQCNTLAVSISLNKSAFSALLPVAYSDVSSSSETPSHTSTSITSSPHTNEWDKPPALKPPGDMRCENERLASFAAWPISFVQPASLAEAGFYYLGRNDEVRCAFCKVEIGRWEDGDNPTVEHERWAPECPLLRRRPTGNVPRLSSSSADTGHDVCGARADPTTTISGPAYPRFAAEEARLRSFTDWPTNMRQRPEDLADAGFFYMGQDDKTVCFHCGGGLNGWESEDRPWEQHARWFKRCAYVQLVKGCDYVQHLASELAAAVTPNEPASKASGMFHSVTPTGPSPSTNSDDTKLCKICFAAEYNVCFVPCGHVVACAKCALTSDKCPLCRRTFQNAVRMFYS